MKLTETNFSKTYTEIWLLPTVVLNNYYDGKTEKCNCRIITISFIIWNIEIVFE